MKYVTIILFALLSIWALVNQSRISQLNKRIEKQTQEREFLLEHNRDIDAQIKNIRYRRIIEDSLRNKPSKHHEEQIEIIRNATAADLNLIILRQVSDSARFNLFFKERGPEDK